EEGVRRARARAAGADFRLIVVDATRPHEAAALGPLTGGAALVVANKVDLAPSDGARWADALGAGRALRLSLRTGRGLTELLARLGTEMKARLDPGSAPVITRARHRAALVDAAAALDRFATATLPELAAEDLRAATRALGRITGRVDVEDMLDIIFREFCIGK
ncbi:MAG TPA: tRNA uridine-5-carboxymethylaminomethyl(34) synthesis GTPase MnmE, partial [Stellaceae bacterium]|nr:tRNA uridine-5-carboxymethylaminomethyl(34) synthesis GTPase MnmE [Stellaceae bacterium]